MMAIYEIPTYAEYLEKRKKYPSTAEWIPVEQALPHYGERVLAVCINRQNKMQRHVIICEYWGRIWSRNREVTHWAPLPELPKD